MFAWRKKSDGGFEWHKYIRTAVRHRRDARREQVHAARRAAGQHLNAAGAALAAGSKAAGSAARDGAVASAGALGLALQAAWAMLAYAVRTVMRPVIEVVSRPTIGVPLALAGAIAVGAGIGRLRSLGARPRGPAHAPGRPGADAAAAADAAARHRLEPAQAAGPVRHGSRGRSGPAGGCRRYCVAGHRRGPEPARQRRRPAHRRQVAAGTRLSGRGGHPAHRRHHREADGHRPAGGGAALRHGGAGLALRRRRRRRPCPGWPAAAP